MLEQALRSTSVHDATLRLGFDDATLRGNTLWLPGRRFRVLSRSAESTVLGAAERRGEALLAESPLGAQYFGHWIRDDLAIRELAAGLGPGGGEAVRLNEAGYRHARWYDAELPHRPRTLHRPTRFERLWIPVDNGQHRGKLLRYRAIRSQIAAALDLSEDAEEQTGPVYLTRGSSGENRSLANGHDVEALVERMGGRVVAPERVSAEEVLRGLWNASLIVAVEGSHAAPWIYAHAPHAALVLLQPPRRVNMVQKGMTECLGSPLGFVVAEPVDEGPAFRLADTTELAHVMERAVAQRGAARLLHEAHHHAAGAGSRTEEASPGHRPSPTHPA